MPRILSEQEYNTIQSRVLQAAPDGLDEANFKRYMGPAMEQALGEAENTAPQPEGSAIGRFAKNAWDALNPIEGAKSFLHAATHQHEAAGQIADAVKDQFQKAMNAYQQARYNRAVPELRRPIAAGRGSQINPDQAKSLLTNFEGAGHAAAGMLPIIGPAAANAGEQIGEGDIAGGLGKAVGIVGSVVGPELATRGAAGAVNKVQGGLRTTAERIINSNVKPPPSLVERNPTINIPRVILDEKLKPGFKGVEQGRKLSAQLGNDVDQLAASDAATGRKYSIDPMRQRLEGLADTYGQNPVGAGDVAQVQAALDELMSNPNYADPAVPPSTSQVPHPTAIDAQGNPLMQSITNPGQPARLRPQDASSIQNMKRKVYEENPKAYGERKGARVQAEKAVGNEAKTILDQNVPGVQEVNARNAGVITARKALNKMGVREANKYPLGPMDLWALAAGAGGHLAAGPVGALPAIAAAVLKHPSTAFPVARGFDALGAMKSPSVVAGATAGLGTAGAAINNGLRPVTKDELDRVKRLLGLQ